MIQAHELRNGVTQIQDYNGNPYTVNCQDILYAELDKKNFNLFHKPFDITEERLTQMGGKITEFKASWHTPDTKHYGYDYCKIKNILFRIRRSSTGIIALYLEDYVFPLTTIHAIQDLYFSLTGEKILIPKKK